MSWATVPGASHWEPLWRRRAFLSRPGRAGPARCTPGGKASTSTDLTAGTAESFSIQSAGLKFYGSYLHSSPSLPIGNLAPRGKQSKKNSHSAKSDVHHPNHCHCHRGDWCQAASFHGRGHIITLGDACPSFIGMIIGPTVVPLKTYVCRSHAFDY